MAASAAHTLLANALKSEKDLFWHNNASLSEDERQRQWAVKTADLASLLTSVPRQEQHISKAVLPKVTPKTCRRQSTV